MFLEDSEKLIHDKPFNSSAFLSKTARWVMKLQKTKEEPNAVKNNTTVQKVVMSSLPPVVMNKALTRALNLYNYEHLNTQNAEDFEKLHVYGNQVSLKYAEESEQEKSVILYQTLVQHEQFPEFMYDSDDHDEWMYSICWVWNTYRSYDKLLKK